MRSIASVEGVPYAVLSRAEIKAVQNVIGIFEEVAFRERNSTQGIGADADKASVAASSVLSKVRGARSRAMATEPVKAEAPAGKAEDAN